LILFRFAIVLRDLFFSIQADGDLEVWRKCFITQFILIFSKKKII